MAVTVRVAALVGVGGVFVLDTRFDREPVELLLNVLEAVGDCVVEGDADVVPVTDSV